MLLDVDSWCHPPPPQHVHRHRTHHSRRTSTTQTQTDPKPATLPARLVAIRGRAATVPPMAAATPGWYEDPIGDPDLLRYYNGHHWTDHTRPRTSPTTGQGTHSQAAAHGTAAAQKTQPVKAPNPFLTNPTISTPAPTRPHKMPATGPAPGLVHHDFDVTPGTTQALLMDEHITWQHKDRPTSADPGWYPDPGRSRKLRFYDGNGWTARTRQPLQAQMKSLPKAALVARAKLLEIADAQATGSSAGRTWRRYQPIRVEQPQSLHRVVRTKSGRVGGTLSMALILVAISMLAFTAWQQFGSDAWQQHNQNQLRDALAEQFQDAGGDYSQPGGPDAVVATPTNPTPLITTRPELTLDPPPTTTGNPTTPPSRPGPPQLGDQPPDIAPFPPTGWTPPAGRTARTLAGYDLGAPVGRLIIPRLSLDEIMVSGVGPNELAKGPGVARYGMLPGSPGNSIIAGHRTGWGEPFRYLDQLRYGDQIIIEIPGQQRVVYEVRGRSIVSPTDTSVLEQTRGVRLTLTTCHPVSVNTERMIVQAEMVEGPWLDKAINRSTWQTIG